MSDPGFQEWLHEVREELVRRGVRFVTAAGLIGSCMTFLEQSYYSGFVFTVNEAVNALLEENDE